MKKSILIATAALALTACGGTPQPKAPDTQAVTTVADTHTAETALDYQGVYKGVLPAADCPGIEVTLTLYDNGTYNENDNYIDRQAFEEKGGYEVKDNLLILTPADGEGVSYYRIEENQLRRLGADKQPVTGEMAERFILTKIVK